VRALFTLRRRLGGRPDDVMVDFEILRTAIRQVVLPRALYAAPVINVDSAAIDCALRKELKALLGLPSTFSSDALHWLLRVWPTEHEVAAARLKLAWRCYHQYWVGNAIRHLLKERPRTYHPLLTTGPLGLLTRTLTRYGLKWADLADPKYAPPSGAAPDDQDDEGEPPDPPSDVGVDVDQPQGEEAQPNGAGFKEWRQMCDKRVDRGIAEWAVHAGQSIPCQSPLKRHFPPSMEQALSMIEGGLPVFLRACGDMGRAGLRLLAPRFGSAVRSDEPCVLCGTGPSTPAHLLDCRGLPPELKTMRTYATVARATAYRAEWDDVRQRLKPSRRKKREPVPKDWLEKSALSMSWPKLTDHQLADHLRWIGHAIDAWCTQWKQTHRGQGPLATWKGVPPLVGLHS
jgi:hypothetical protein